MLDYPIAGPDDGHCLPVAEGVYWVRMPLPFALDHVNLWLLEDGDGWTLVDTGLGLSEIKIAWEALEDSFLGGEPIRRLVVTHFHPDHIGLAHWFQRRYQASVWMTADEQAAAQRVHERSDEQAGASLVHMFAAHGLDAERQGWVNRRGNTYRRIVDGLPDPVQHLKEGITLDIGGRRWRVVTGQGHSPEHACLFCDEAKILIAGDQVLPRITSNISVPVWEPDADPLAAYLESLRHLRVLAADTLVLPSHGQVFHGLHSRLDELAAHHEHRLDDLRGGCGEACTAADMLPVLFRRELDSHTLFFAMGEAIAHLNRLWHSQEFRRVTDGQGVLRYEARRP